MTGTRTVALVIAPEDFRDEELFVPKAAFEKAGLQTVVASTRQGVATGMLGGTQSVDRLVDDLDAGGLAAVVVVGGGGSLAHLWHHAPLHRLLQAAHAAGKPVGAICISPAVLAYAGLLEGRKATVWAMPETATAFAEGGAIDVGQPVVTDGKIVTANGPAAAAAFAEALLTLLR